MDGLREVLNAPIFLGFSYLDIILFLCLLGLFISFIGVYLCLLLSIFSHGKDKDKNGEQHNR